MTRRWRGARSTRAAPRAGRTARRPRVRACARTSVLSMTSRITLRGSSCLSTRSSVVSSVCSSANASRERDASCGLGVPSTPSSMRSARTQHSLQV